MMEKNLTHKAYGIAREQYASFGVNTGRVLERMAELAISLHCWQADDVGGFEKPDSEPGSGGIRVTGKYPGKARTIAEMRQDLEKVFSLLPGRKRLNLHAMYGEFGGKPVDRDQVDISHFQGWIDWAKVRGIGLDFNATCFAHPRAEDGFTLSSKNQSQRKFWMDHVARCRAISAEMGKQLGTPAIHNLWIPDGSKDTPVDRAGHRALLQKSLDEIFAVHYPEQYMKDAVESKLFGIGSESCVIGSYDFYLAYAVRQNKIICLDNGHFHPAEQVGDKIPAILPFVGEILLHLTRGVRWDSDHVVTYNDEILQIAQEVVRANALKRVHIGLDFFDASINRIGAYVVGTRAVQKAFLFALLEPAQKILEYEEAGKYFERLAMLEEMKSMPFGAVWDYYCLQQGVPAGTAMIEEVQKYEKEVLLLRENE